MPWVQISKFWVTELTRMFLHDYSSLRAGISSSRQRNQQLLCLLLNRINQGNIHRFWSMVQLFPLRKRILSVTHDTMYTFAAHCRNQAVKVRARNNILKTLTGTTWGQQKETIILTDQAIGRSVINYAALVWAPVINESSWKCLQTAQNDAFRIATGCHKMAHSDHLQQETKILPVKSHSELLAKQYWQSHT